MVYRRRAIFGVSLYEIARIPTGANASVSATRLIRRNRKTHQFLLVGRQGGPHGSRYGTNISAIVGIPATDIANGENRPGCIGRIWRASMQSPRMTNQDVATLQPDR